MRNCLYLFCIVFSSSAFSQRDSIYARLEITSVSWEEHRTWIDTSIILTLEKIGRTEIISVGKIDSTEIGFQWELLKSRLGNTEIYVSGKAYYLKKDGKWQMHHQPTYQAAEFKVVSTKPSTMPEDYGMASMTIQRLQLDYKQHYFIVR